jgi:hypothetical protein
MQRAVDARRQGFASEPKKGPEYRPLLETNVVPTAI